MPIEADARADEIKALARDWAEDMIAALADVARDPDQKGAARVAAAKTLLERGFGAPERKVEKTVDVNIHDHRQAHLSALRKLADRNTATMIPDLRENDGIEDAEFTDVPKKEK